MKTSGSTTGGKFGSMLRVLIGEGCSASGDMANGAVCGDGEFIGDPGRLLLGVDPLDDVACMLMSVSDSFEFNRRSATRNLLGDAVSVHDSDAKHRRFANEIPSRCFFGDGSISDSDKSDG